MLNNSLERDGNMGRKWNNIKDKKPKKTKIQVESMLNLVEKYM